jgi:hypothetical protein
MPKSFLNNHKVRGLRNNNPGNLVRTSNAWQGKIPYPQSKDTQFEQFENILFGLRAMFKDLINDINKGKNTVKKLIYEYAPPNENNTEKYIQSVCNSIGVSPNQEIKSINNEFLVLLGRAIIKVELGNSHSEISDKDLDNALQILGNVSTDKLKVTIKKSFKYLPALAFLLFFF